MTSKGSDKIKSYLVMDERQSLFRQSALDQQNMAEDLDELLELTPRSRWLLILAAACFGAGLLVWLVWG